MQIIIFKHGFPENLSSLLLFLFYKLDDFSKHKKVYIFLIIQHYRRPCNTACTQKRKRGVHIKSQRDRRNIDGSGGSRFKGRYNIGCWKIQERKKFFIELLPSVSLCKSN